MGLIGKVRARLRRDAGLGVERTHLYARPVSADAPALEGHASVRIERVEAPATDALAALGFDDRDAWAARLARGDQCYGAWIGDELVHYSWVQTRGEHPLSAAGAEVPIAAGDLWIYNCRTADVHRGKRIYPTTLRAILRDHASAGARTAWIYTRSDNVASQRGITRVGFAHVATLRALRVGRRFLALGRVPAERA